MKYTIYKIPKRDVRGKLYDGDFEVKTWDSNPRFSEVVTLERFTLNGIIFPEYLFSPTFSFTDAGVEYFSPIFNSSYDIDLSGLHIGNLLTYKKLSDGRFIEEFLSDEYITHLDPFGKPILHLSLQYPSTGQRYTSPFKHVDDSLIELIDGCGGVFFYTDKDKFAKVSEYFYDSIPSTFEQLTEDDVIFIV